ncbi:hypothetical protein P3T21_000936 [Paraburkholderia sp. GAS334]
MDFVNGARGKLREVRGLGIGLQAQRRLAQVDALCGTREATFLGQRNEMREAAGTDPMHVLQRPYKEIALDLFRYTTSNGRKHGDPDPDTGQRRYTGDRFCPLHIPHCAWLSQRA